MPHVNIHQSTGKRLGLTAGLLFISGCQHVNVAQITYEALRAEDCRRNQLDTFCGRTYAFDYYEYLRMRRDFLHSQEKLQVQASRNKVISEGSAFHAVLKEQ